MNEDTKKFVIGVSESLARQEDLEAQEEKPMFEVGDVVIVSRGYKNKRYTTHVIKSISKTGQILLNNGMRFMPDGRIIGGGPYEPIRLLEATPELLEMAIHQEYVSYLSAVQWGLLDNDMLYRVLDVLSEELKNVPDH